MGRPLVESRAERGVSRFREALRRLVHEKVVERGGCARTTNWIACDNS
jgi:hypothetical protein